MNTKEITQNSIAEARTNFSNLIREAELGKDIRQTRPGKPVAIIVGRQKLDRMTNGYRSFSQFYRKFLREYEFKELDIDVDAMFLQSRDRSKGRDVNL